MFGLYIRHDLCAGSNDEQGEGDDKQGKIDEAGEECELRWREQEQEVETLCQPGIFTPGCRAEAYRMCQQEVAAQRGQQGNAETQQHDETKPERQDTILNQDQRDRQVEAKIGLAICYLPQFAASMRVPRHLPIKNISDDADKKDE